MLKDFRIYATKLEFEEDNGTNSYTIDHTVFTYLMSDENKYVNFYGSSMSEN